VCSNITGYHTRASHASPSRVSHASRASYTSRAPHTFAGLTSLHAHVPRTPSSTFECFVACLTCLACLARLARLCVPYITCLACLARLRVPPVCLHDVQRQTVESSYTPICRASVGHTTRTHTSRVCISMSMDTLIVCITMACESHTHANGVCNIHAHVHILVVCARGRVICLSAQCAHAHALTTFASHAVMMFATHAHVCLNRTACPAH
jgi:hypothetical protein